MYEDFNEDNLYNPDIIVLTQKVSVVQDDEFTAKLPAIRGARVVIRLNGGREFEKCVLYPKGEQENPIDC